MEAHVLSNATVTIGSCRSTLSTLPFYVYMPVLQQEMPPAAHALHVALQMLLTWWIVVPASYTHFVCAACRSNATAATPAAAARPTAGANLSHGPRMKPKKLSGSWKAFDLTAVPIDETDPSTGKSAVLCCAVLCCAVLCCAGLGSAAAAVMYQALHTSAIVCTLVPSVPFPLSPLMPFLFPTFFCQPCS